jgi:hypothetical protein
MRERGTMDPGRHHSALDELAAHHLDRSRVYAVVATLLDDRAPQRCVAAARATLIDDGRVVPRASMLADLLVSLPDDHDIDAPGYTLDCADPHARSRRDAHVAAGLQPARTKVVDVRALSALAQTTARTLRRGDIAEAARLNDLQHRFLRGHAHDCLTALSRELLGGTVALYVVVGELLLTQLECDAETA